MKKPVQCQFGGLTTARLVCTSLITLCLGLLSACGEDDSGNAATFNVGGTITGLAAGTRLGLINNGDPDSAFTVTANGSYTLSSPVAAGSSYAVTISRMPSGQFCSVSNGAGAGVTANVSKVNVQCVASTGTTTGSGSSGGSTNPSAPGGPGTGGAGGNGNGTTTFNVGGVISGLVGSITLINNGDAAHALTATSNGGYTLGLPVVVGSGYAVTIGSMPAGQFCTVSNGSGAMGAANVSNVNITCIASSGTTIGGGTSGGGTDPTVPGGPGTGGAGGNGNGSTTFNVGGVISGLGGSITLINNGDVAHTLTATSNGGYTLGVPLVVGSGYAVTIGSMPAGQFCSVSNGIGVMGTANISNVNIKCTASAGTTTGGGSSGGGTDPTVSGGPGTGGSGGNGNGSTTFNVGGVISGLSGTITLIDNGDPATALTTTANGGYTLGVPVVAGSSYAVTVSRQPSGQFCSVSNAAGVVGANVSNVNIQCVASNGTTIGAGSSGGSAGTGGVTGGGGNGTTTFNVGGTITGLSGTVALVNNGDVAHALAVTANGGFTFGLPVAAGSNYAVTVSSQPSGQFCSVANATGAGVVANISAINVVCVASNGTTTTPGLAGGGTGTGGVTGGGGNGSTTFNVGGSIAGLSGGTLTLINNGNSASALAVTSNGGFTLGVPVALGGSYNVSVAAQPTGQTCTVSNGTLAYMAANVTNVSVVCATTASGSFSIGGTVTGLLSGKSLTVVNNGDTANPITLSANGSFTMPVPVAAGSGYNITVAAQPAAQVCGVKGTGSNVTANITSVAITCLGAGGMAIAPVPLTPALSGAGTPNAVPGVLVTTMAGGGTCTAPCDNAVGVNAAFIGAEAATTDGNYVYIADAIDYVAGPLVIRRVSLTPPYAVTTIAGNPSGTTAVDAPIGLNAVLGPCWNGLTSDGANLYMADSLSHSIRKISLSPPYAVTTLASIDGGTYGPWGLAISPDGSTLYTGGDNGKISRVNIATGAVSVPLGNGINSDVDGVGTAAGFYQPLNLVINQAGTTLYVIGYYGVTIRAVDLATNAVTTIAGDLTDAVGNVFTYPAPGSLQKPTPVHLAGSMMGLTTDGSNLYFMAGDPNNGFQSLQQMNLATGLVTTLVGTSNASVLINNTSAPSTTVTPNANLRFSFALSLVSDGTNLYVLDSSSGVLVKVH
ncbi:hypothetical protein DIC66_20185 [Rhodoferax lacus]|uniref:Uncharacterized protein n=1 Tax=Rhodoferax lacus TaxID=2184758 RepID=A0A3E1R6S7_9BURK|nr:hypothetical protein [Rhodoferax lacus]RFO95078.1 hypothetical protein DIC66_20185 [Rhodoferax lacus]